MVVTEAGNLRFPAPLPFDCKECGTLSDFTNGLPYATYIYKMVKGGVRGTAGSLLQNRILVSSLISRFLLCSGFIHWLGSGAWIRGLG